MKVLIIGGGIGGPALATFLSRTGTEVTLIEQAPQWKNIGFGVTVWGIGRKILKELGIDEKVAAYAYPVPFMRLSKMDGTPLKDLEFGQFKELGGEVVIVPRARLHESILETIPPSVRLLLGTTIQEMKEEQDQVIVRLSDGSVDSFDLVVGADGMRSKTRERFFGPDQLKYYGWTFQVFWMPDGVVRPDYALCVSGLGHGACFYPTKEGGFFGIIEYNPERKMLDARTSLEPFVPYLLKNGWTAEHIEQAMSEGPKRFVDHLSYIEMGPWNSGRVVLLGDARHGFAPIIGMGGSLALEDAKVLAEELERGGMKDVDAALKRYGERRTVRVSAVQGLSRFIHPWFNISSSSLMKLRDVVAPHMPERILRSKVLKVLEYPI